MIFFIYQVVCVEWTNRLYHKIKDFIKSIQIYIIQMAAVHKSHSNQLLSIFESVCRLSFHKHLICD